MKDLFEKLLILRTPKIGPARYRALLDKFGSIQAVAESLKSDNAHIDMVRREMDMAAEMGVHYISDEDVWYPKSLQSIENHPPVITVRGNIEALKCPMISMVGTRHATAAGMNFMSDMATAFAQNGFSVVSGMAMGCDTAAHRGALKGGGYTVAVLAGGVDYIWPLENESLYYEILEQGCVISEMPVGFKPIATNFVQRNRIVAGLGDCLILGEADIKSGSMTTARFAKEYNKIVYALPSHPSDPRSVGPNSLIKSGDAVLCSGPDDFFDMSETNTKKTQNEKKSDSGNSLIDALGIIPVSESVLAQVVKKTVSEIKSELVILELQGLVRKVDGGYVRA